MNYGAYSQSFTQSMITDTSWPAFPFPAERGLANLIPMAKRTDSEAMSQSFVSNMLSVLPDIVLAVTPRGQIQYISRSIATTLGFNPDDLINQNLDKIVHPNDIVSLLRDIKDSSNVAPRNVELVSPVLSAPSTYSGSSGSSSQWQSSRVFEDKNMYALFRVQSRVFQNSYVWLEAVGRFCLNSD